MRDRPRPPRGGSPRRAGIRSLVRVALGLAASAAWASGSIAVPSGSPGAGIAAADAPRVAVLVHGFQGLWPWSRGYRCSDGLVAYAEAGPPMGRAPRDEAEFGRLAGDLARQGYDLYFARWTSHGGETSSLREAGECLATQIQDARRRASAKAGLPVRQVTLIAHSMGGLVSRAYLEGQGYVERGDVDQLITFGTPHQGVASDVLLRLIAAFNPASIVGGFLPCATSPGTCELSYDAMAAFNRGHFPRGGVAYNLVAGDKAIYPFSWFISGADDGLVEAASAAGLPVAGWRVHDSHTALGGLASDHYMESDESLRCLQRFLGLGSRQAACTAFASGAKAAAQTKADPMDLDLSAGIVPNANAAVSPPPSISITRLPQTPIETGRLVPGDSRTDVLALDGSPGVVVVGWSGGQLDAALRLADGRQLAADPGEHGPLVFRLPRGAAGSAVLELENGGGEMGAFAFYAVLASPVDLTARLVPEPGQPLVPGGRIGLTARVTEAGLGVAGASVEAAYRIGGRVRRIGLADLGDGAYQAELSVPSVPGLVHVVILARGRSGAGLAFEREVGRVVIVGDGAALAAQDD